MILLFLQACLLAPIDDRIYLEDVDEDGFTAIEGDCAPEEFNRHPGADEYCNDLDDDCDGTPDNDPVDGGVYYTDADGDSYGNPDGMIRLCAPVEGYADRAGDCDDSDADVTEEQTWYYDGDGDGFGDARSSKVSCDPGPGWVLNGEDCDDNDAGAIPDQSWFRDDDLDGFGGTFVATQCARPIGAVDNSEDCDDADADEHPGAVWYVDADEDDYGEADGTGQESCERPSGLWAPREGDCLDSDPNVSPAQTEICDDNLDNDCNPLTSCLPAPINDVSISQNTDLRIVGTQVGANLGRAVHAGPLGTGDRASLFWLDSDYVVYGLYGSSITRTGGDFTGTIFDFAIDGDTEAFGQQLEVVDRSKPNTVLIPDHTYGDGVVSRHGPPVTGQTGAWESRGEYRGTNLANNAFAYSIAKCEGFLGGMFAIGAPDSGLDNAGRVFVMTEYPTNQEIHLISTSSELVQTYIDGASLTGFGISLACMGRRNDAVAMAIGAYKSPGATVPAVIAPSDRGAVYLFGGDVEASTSVSFTDASVALLGPAGTAAHFGANLANAGDFDGDGLDDLLVAAPSYDNGAHSKAGKVYLISGALPVATAADVESEAVEDYLLGTFTLGQTDAEIGTTLAAGDFNGDGRSDIAIGAPQYDPDGGTANGGVVWMFLGGHTDKVHHDLLDLEDAGRIKYYSSQAGAGLGRGLAFGDFDDDGYDDLAMGAPSWDTTQNNAGAVFVVFGGAE